MSEKDGGPAFPAAVERQEMCDDRDGYRTVREHEGGMTLRDYFAAQWLTANSGFFSTWSVEETARMAYEAADAMLKEREK